MDENDAVNLLNAMNGYILASEELAVLLAYRIGGSDERIQIAQNQMHHSYTLFQDAFNKAAHLLPVFHPSQATIQPGIVYPHGIGRSRDVVVWSEPRWTVEH